MYKKSAEQRQTVYPGQASVLVVDDDEAIRDLVCEELAAQGYLCDVASDANDAQAKLKRHSFDVLLLDIKLPGMSGIDLLKIVKKCYQTTAIVMMTAVKNLDTAIEAMKLGASDYVVKPFTLDKLDTSISRVLEKKKPQRTVYDTMPSTGDGDYGKNTYGHSLSKINAIAYGVDAQVDYFDFHSKAVTMKTVELARWLGIPEKEIQKWATARDELYSERDRRIKSGVSKLERSPMAQAMLGLTRSLGKVRKSGGEQN